LLTKINPKSRDIQPVGFIIGWSLNLVLAAASPILFGWVSGIFRALRKKPKFEFSSLTGPTFSCTFETGRKHNGHLTHRTSIVLYLKLKNVGTAASSISKINVGYHNSTFRYKIHLVLAEYCSFFN